MGSVPGGYRNTINDNLVLILMIETLEGLKNADEIAKVPGVHAIFAASGDLGNFSGYQQGDPDYERAINIVHDAAIKAGRSSAAPSRGGTARTSPASRRRTRRRRSRAARAPSSATCTTRRRNPKSVRLPRSNGLNEGR